MQKWTLDAWKKSQNTNEEETDEPSSKSESEEQEEVEHSDTTIQTAKQEVQVEINKQTKQYIDGMKNDLGKRLNAHSPIKNAERDFEKTIENYKGAKKLILHAFISPGDIVTMTAALRDLHKTYPKQFITDVDTNCPEIWENNPYITKIPHRKEGENIVCDVPDVKIIRMDYPLIHGCNDKPYHFIHGYAQNLADKIGLPHFLLNYYGGDIHISDEEKSWVSQVHEVLEFDPPFWLVNAGTKNDYTAKGWSFQRFQEVVNALPEIFFVQIGSKEHNHRLLKGKNVINLVGKTDLRQLIRLVYHSYGVLTGVSLPMHLAAAIEMHPRWKRKTRPCVVLAGGREPSQWEAYPHHSYLHTCGKLPCCDLGGCWKSRVEPLDIEDDPFEKENKSICKHPVTLPGGDKIPLCLDMIKTEDVVREICEYMNPMWDLTGEEN